MSKRSCGFICDKRRWWLRPSRRWTGRRKRHHRHHRRHSLGMCGYAFLFSHPVKLDVFMVPSAVAIPLGCWPTTIQDDDDDATGSDWNLMPANNFQSFSSHHSHGLYSTVLGSHSLTHSLHTQFRTRWCCPNRDATENRQKFILPNF